MRIVLDTNVLISGAFFRGIPSRILDACIHGRFEPALSMEILEEYRRVGEEFAQKRPNDDFEDLLALFVARAVIVEPVPLDAGVCRDPDDDKFIACALAADAIAIVTGDKDLLAVPEDFGIRSVTPREFMSEHMGSERN